VIEHSNTDKKTGCVIRQSDSDRSGRAPEHGGVDTRLSAILRIVAVFMLRPRHKSKLNKRTTSLFNVPVTN
jgi:hypothetical protein